jgi:hypothetical protein
MKWWRQIVVGSRKGHEIRGLLYSKLRNTTLSWPIHHIKKANDLTGICDLNIVHPSSSTCSSGSNRMSPSHMSAAAATVKQHICN